MLMGPDKINSGDRAATGEMDSLPEETLASLAGWLKRYTGLSFPPRRWKDLERHMTQAMAEFEFQDPGRFVQWLLASAPPDRKLIEALASHLTVGETYFFREWPVYQVLEENILPEIIRARRNHDRRLRIWCAGCSSGEEPYSLAILLHRLLPDRQDWNLSVLGTDINPVSLHKAEEGMFNNWSLRECPPWARKHYFQETGPNKYAIIPEIRKMVTFAYLNLVEDTYPSLLSFTNAMDVILCRNVLMYFSEETATAVVDSLANCLVPEGWLALSPVEGAFVRSGSLSPHRFPRALLYRKGEKTPEADRRRTDAAAFSAVLPDVTARASTGMAPTRRRKTVADKRPAAAPRTRRTDIPATGQRSPLERARDHFFHGRYGNTTQELQAIDAGHPDHLEALTLLARCHANQGNLTEAVRCCDLALSANRLSAGVHLLRSTILQEQGAEAEARESLKRAIYLDPDCVMAHFAMFVLNHRQGAKKEAERHRRIVEKLLSRCGQEEVLPDSDGITAGRLTETILSWAAL